MPDDSSKGDVNMYVCGSATGLRECGPADGTVRQDYRGLVNIVIGGVPRAGKSRLAQRVSQQCHCNVMHVDALTNHLKRHYAHAFGMEWRLDGVPRPDPTEPVVLSMVANAGTEFLDLRVYDSSVVTPEAVAATLPPPWTYAVFVGYPQAASEDMAERVRRAAHDDPCCWSHDLGDDELLRMMGHFCSLSRHIQQACSTCGMDFCDVSTDWEGAMAQALASILARIKEGTD